MGVLVGIDQGTSGTTVLVLDPALEVRAVATRPVSSRHTEDGGVEQDPWALLASIVEACGEALEGVSEEVDGAGLAHQGETVLAWDPDTADPLTPAIVWSDRRPEAVARRLADDGVAGQVFDLSGMRLDSYFCATKYRWMLETFPALTERADSGRLRLGTLETWLLRQLGSSESTDVGTASRTQLCRLGHSEWDPGLLDIFGVPEACLVPIRPSIADHGALLHQSWETDLPLRAVMVDQPAALIGNGCLAPGDMKVTYGTGAFVVANAGRAMPSPQQSVVSSVGWSDSEGPVFTLDGGVLSVGSALDWLGRLGVDVTPEAHLRLVGRPPTTVTVTPAFHGLGAPHWDRGATASISGLTAATTGDDLLQGFLDSFALRVAEIVAAIVAAGVPRPSLLRVDGGLSQSPYLVQRQAEVLGVPVVVADIEEATALGVAIAAAGP